MFNIDALRGCTYATIRAAFNNSEEIIEEYGDMGSANITGIMTKIMQDVGRFSERWSSDALYNLDNLRDIAGKASWLEQPFDEIFAFGIRADGVDGNSFLVQRIADTRDYMTGYVFQTRVYRRILAVRAIVSKEPGFSAPRARFSLRDLTHAFRGIDKADLQDAEDRMSKLRDIPFEDGISPEPHDERDRTDKAMIRKLYDEGYKSFRLRDVPSGELEEDGCAGDVTCVEVYGVRDPRVPAPKDLAEAAVCRVYLSGDKDIIVSWTDRWYRFYDDVKKEIQAAKARLLAGAGNSTNDDRGGESDEQG